MLLHRLRLQQLLPRRGRKHGQETALLDDVARGSLVQIDRLCLAAGDLLAAEHVEDVEGGHAEDEFVHDERHGVGDALGLLCGGAEAEVLLHEAVLGEGGVVVVCVAQAGDEDDVAGGEALGEGLQRGGDEVAEEVAEGGLVGGGEVRGEVEVAGADVRVLCVEEGAEEDDAVGVGFGGVV